MLNEILTRQPVNKTAAIVASEGHRDNPSAIDLLRHERENIVSAINSIKALIGKTPKGNPERNKLKSRLAKLEQDIRDVNKQIGVTNCKDRADVGNYIIDEAKKMLTKHQWEKVMTNAYKRHFEEANQPADNHKEVG